MGDYANEHEDDQHAHDLQGRRGEKELQSQSELAELTMPIKTPGVVPVPLGDAEDSVAVVLVAPALYGS